jgi:integrase/recombinase XerD
MSRKNKLVEAGTTAGQPRLPPCGRGSPGGKVLTPARKPRTRIPVAEWPRLDRIRWLANPVATEPFGAATAAVKWRAATCGNIENSYGRWLAWLEVNSPSALKATPADRITREAISVYLDNILARVNDRTAAEYLRNIVSAITVIAPNCEFSWIRMIAAKLRRRTRGAKDKSSRHVPTTELRRLGISLMSSVSLKKKCVTGRDAIEFRDGLIIALLALRPLRGTNFRTIEIGRHLTLTGGTMWLRFQASETKNNTDLGFPVPATLLKQLEFYMDVVRPALARDRPQRGLTKRVRNPRHWLWISQKGNSLSRSAFYDLIIRRTMAAFGRPLNPHLFRDCLATTLSSPTAGLAWTSRHLLGHRGPHTSELCYNRIRGAGCAAKFLAHVESLRQVDAASVCRAPKPDRTKLSTNR